MKCFSIHLISIMAISMSFLLSILSSHAEQMVSSWVNEAFSSIESLFKITLITLVVQLLLLKCSYYIIPVITGVSNWYTKPMPAKWKAELNDFSLYVSKS
jgi:hypothetical protein